MANNFNLFMSKYATEAGFEVKTADDFSECYVTGVTLGDVGTGLMINLGMVCSIIPSALVVTDAGETKQITYRIHFRTSVGGEVIWLYDAKNKFYADYQRLVNARSDY